MHFSARIVSVFLFCLSSGLQCQRFYILEPSSKIMWGSWTWNVKIILLLLSTFLLIKVIDAKKHHLKNHNHHHHNNEDQHINEKHHKHKRSENQLRTLKLYGDTVEVKEYLSGSVNVPINGKPIYNIQDYYKRLTHRKLNQLQPSRTQKTNEWNYHTYNTNNSRSDKGDDNIQDVEFVSISPPTTSTTTTTTTTTPQSWYVDNTRKFFSSKNLTTPPALVPLRRGYNTVLSSTQPPITSQNDTISTLLTEEINTHVNRSSYPPYNSEEMERRHICVQQRVIMTPVKTKEIYTRPIWKHVSTKCQLPSQSNQMCTRVQLVHEHAVRDVIRHKSAQSVTYDCCIGWTRVTPLSESCLKPICSTRCQNGGTCTGPDSCSCTTGYTGRHCEQDINECQKKPCDQTCINTMGSYNCRCREGFMLQSDRQSCKKITMRDEDAFEARDLENEVDMVGENVSTRLHKIERSLAYERVQTHDLKRSLQSTYNAVDLLKSRLSTLEKQQLDVNRLQTNLHATENRILNLLIKCRNGPKANCP